MTTILAALFGACLGWLAREMIVAPEDWEDAAGYHDGPASHFEGTSSRQGVGTNHSPATTALVFPLRAVTFSDATKPFGVASAAERVGELSSNHAHTNSAGGAG